MVRSRMISGGRDISADPGTLHLGDWKLPSTPGAVATLLLSMATLFVFSVSGARAMALGCPNEAFRTGQGAELPDCRAYELVTPADSRGRRFGDLATETVPFDLFANELASPERDSFVFAVQGSALRGPGQGNGTLLGDIYQSIRSPSGWKVVRHVTPTGAEAFTPDVGGISTDHEYNFIFVPKLFGGTNGTLGEEIDYLGDSAGHYEFTGVGSLGVEPVAQGRYISPGGKHVIFSTGHEALGESAWCFIVVSCQTQKKRSVAKLEPNAPGGGTGVIYDRAADGPTHVVSLLPGDVTPENGENAIYQGASADGTVVAFKINGVLYVRVNNANTIEIVDENPSFGGLSNSGVYLFYAINGNIHRFNTVLSQDEQVNASGDGEMVNASADGSHVYFVSRQAITGAEKNSIGDAAIPPAKGTGELSAGSTVVTGVASSQGSFVPGMEVSGEGIPPETVIEAIAGNTMTLSNSAGSSSVSTISATSPNLYVWTGASPRFVATLAASDVDGVPGLTTWTSHVVAPIDEPGRGPGADPSRTTGNGDVILFESRAQLTSYDNAGQTMIYRYDDQSGELRCVSCNPLGAPATADARLGDYDTLRRTTIIHNVSSDGRRVFFETAEPLISADTDGINDIYQWYLAPNEESPTLSLISSGKSTDYPQVDNVAPPQPNILLSVTPDGRDVFFIAQDALVLGAPGNGASAIYDARIDGGFATPSPPPPACQLTRACQGESGPPPPLPGASSQVIIGAGNIRLHKRHRCSEKHHRTGRKHHVCHVKTTRSKR